MHKFVSDMRNKVKVGMGKIILCWTQEKKVTMTLKRHPTKKKPAKKKPTKNGRGGGRGKK